MLCRGCCCISRRHVIVFFRALTRKSRRATEKLRNSWWCNRAKAGILRPSKQRRKHYEFRRNNDPVRDILHRRRLSGYILNGAHYKGSAQILKVRACPEGEAGGRQKPRRGFEAASGGLQDDARVRGRITGSEPSGRFQVGVRGFT